MKQASSAGAAPRREAEAQPVLVTDLNERLREIDRAIAERAYELFEEHGYTHGNDIENWLQAEAEMLQPIACDLKESGQAITLAAPVRGFTAGELAVTIEPRRLVVCGKHEEKGRGERMLRCVVELPAEIDPAQAKAELRGEHLSVVLLKTRQD
jgi:HSP20 family molecular chaperone IbpA